MTKTLVEQLRTETDPEWFRALMITAASRIEELESHLAETVRLGKEEAMIKPPTDFDRGFRIARIVAGEEAARSLALSDKG
jgi:hypothetical protein